MKQFERKVGQQGAPYLETALSGVELLRVPVLSKGTAFTLDERRELGLHGYLPPRVTTLGEQLDEVYSHFRSLTRTLDQHLFVRELQDTNEVLFYALLARHLEELLPVIYTPVVAEGVRNFNRVYRYPRGLVVTPDTIDHLDELLAALPHPDVQLAVVTDNEAILGIGDQGVGGIAICIGKLSLYTAAAGIDPAVTLPIDLDVGTNRKELLENPHYLGWKHPRLEGEAYDAFIAKFVNGFRRRFPNALLQWEDLSKQKAFDVLERHRDALPSFNDDIQGTGAVVLAGLLTATRRLGQKLSDQRFVVHGAGAGGVGVARQLVRGLMQEGLSAEDARSRIFLIDSKGLILSDRKGLERYKQELAARPERIAGWKLAGPIPTLLETVEQAKVTVLLGLSGQQGAFEEPVVRAVARNTQTPTVFALSNPTSSSEAIPADVLRWSEGRALVATGSPFAPVTREGGQTQVIGQGNNAFIFPGVGKGVLVAGAKRVTDGMLTVAAKALSEFSGGGTTITSLYPKVERIQDASLHVMIAVIREAQREGLATRKLPEDLAGHLSGELWKPEYVPVRRRGRVDDGALSRWEASSVETGNGARRART